MRLRTVAIVLVALFLFACSSAEPTESSESQPLTIVADGVDYSFARPSPSGLYAGGYRFACRYLSPPPNEKNLSKSEAQSLWAAGVDVVSNFEEDAENSLDGYAQGVTDAKLADGQAQADGMPPGRPIYFSVDFDATEAQQTTIDDYFDGVASVIGLGRTGAYGGYYVIQRLFDAGKITWGWQTYAWSGGQWDARAQLRQVLNDITAAGDSDCCDHDQAVANDFGQWHAPNANDPCSTAPTNGFYCGQSTQWGGGTKDVLYDCEDGATKSKTTCAAGCVVEAEGKPDQCNPVPEGGPAEAGDDAQVAPPTTTDDAGAGANLPAASAGGCSASPSRARSPAFALALLALAQLRRRRRQSA